MTGNVLNIFQGLSLGILQYPGPKTQKNELRFTKMEQLVLITPLGTTGLSSDLRNLTPEAGFLSLCIGTSGLVLRLRLLDEEQQW